MKSYILAICIGALFFNNNSFGQDSIKNTALAKKMDSIFSGLNNQTPGVAVIVLKGGSILSKKTYGMANIELQVPFTHQSVVRIGYSEAREFISIAAVLMEKDGLLSLHDKVRKHFPELPEWSEPVTVWDLLNHRSGFVDEWSTMLLMRGSMSDRFDKEPFLRLLYKQPEPEIEPGKGYMYCNSDFGLLRLIMEKASGKNLSAWIKQRVFDTLRMNNTRMQKNPREIIPNRTAKYENDGSDYFHENTQKTSPGGNYYILTCADDLVKWSMALDDPGSEFNAAFNTLIENVRMIPGKKNHYVTGHTLDILNGHRVIFHEGVNGENYLSRIPSKGLTIITMGNKNGDGFAAENRLLCDYLINVKKQPFIKPVFIKAPVVMTETELTKYTGKYRWLNQVSWQSNNEGRKYSDFFIEKGKLKVRYNGNYTVELVPVAKDIFYYEEDFGMQLTFAQPEGQPLTATIAFDDGFPGETMEKMETNWQPTPEELKLFTGKYYSSHLDFYWDFALNEKGKLVLHRTAMPDVIIEPDGENQFYYIGEKYPGSGFDQWILFHKDSIGKITGFTVLSGRVMHHKFEKKSMLK